MKKLTALFLALALCLSLCTVTAFADNISLYIKFDEQGTIQYFYTYPDGSNGKIMDWVSGDKLCEISAVKNVEIKENQLIIEFSSTSFDVTCTVEAKAKDGYTFDKWEVEGDYSKGEKTTFKAVFVETYTVTVDNTQHGTVTATPVKAASGTNVTLTVTPENGYQLKSLKCEKEMTVANLLAAQNFPHDYTNSNWVNKDTEKSNYKVYYDYDMRYEVTAIIVQTGTGSCVCYVEDTSTLTPVEGGYKATSTNVYLAGKTVTFYVDDVNQQITSIVVDGASGGDADANGTYAPAGTLPEGSSVNWEVSLTRQPNGTYTFTMPAANVTVTAEFEAKPTPHHHGGGGSTTPTVTSATTADAGIALYGVLTVSSLLGMGWVAKRKR